MTCVVGIEYAGKVAIVADLLGSEGNLKIEHTEPKVFVRNKVIFGYTTSYRFGQLIQHVMPEPCPPEEAAAVYAWLVSEFVPALRRTLKDNDCVGGQCLIGVNGQLWWLQDDFAVVRPADGYFAIGSGADFAIGALHALSNETSVHVLIDQALRTAAHFCPTVGTQTHGVY